MTSKCQIFTPLDYVVKLLNTIDYSENLYGKKVLENSCGDGNILEEIVKRYIRNSLYQGFSKQKIKEGLANDIWAFEIDEKHISNCIERLNILAYSFGLTGIRWNIQNRDYLHFDMDNYFDYIIGNPPYVSYRDIQNDIREFVKEKFEVCKFGKFDYCYAFIEKSIKDLKPEGKMAYLIPASIMKNVFGKDLRNFMLPHLEEVYDYSELNIFKNALTTSAILNIKKNTFSTKIKYTEVKENKSRMIKKQDLGSKWVFSKDNNAISEGEKFGNYFKVANSVATLANKIFVLHEYEDIDNNFIKVGEFLIEKNILRKASSPKGEAKGKKEYIIFPYRYEDGKVLNYSTEEFEFFFPECSKYLKDKKELLLKRDTDNKAKWFDYGRSQALEHINQEKLLVSSIVTGEVKLYKLNKDTVPYSGFYIIPKTSKSLDEAIDLLGDSKFIEYIKSIGISASGNSKRITVKDIENFTI